MTLPPRPLVEDAVLHAVVPPAAAAAGVFGLLILVFGRRAAPWAAAVAFVAALAAGNYAKQVLPWQPDPGKRAEWTLVLAAAGAVAGLARCPGWAAAGWAAVLALGVAKVCPAAY